MEDWKKDWQPMIRAIGKDFHEGVRQWGADPIERGAIRRFLEPLEFDCPLHYDQEAARANGYRDLVAPCSSLFTWLIPPYWEPGRTVFRSPDKNAPAAELPLLVVKTDLAPPTPYYFATNVEIDFFQPMTAGDRLCKVGDVLLSCIPKETRVGRGAFLVWETRVENQDGELVAVIRLETYHYFPHEHIAQKQM
jgi:hypothetical protein